MKKRSSKIKNAFAKVHFLWFVVLAVGTLIIIWLLPIDEKLNEVNAPNLNAQKYVMSKDYKIAVEDGFLYRINRTNFGGLKAVTIKQTAPISEVNITVKKPASATLNILNATDYTKIYLNGRSLDTKLYPANIYYSKNLNDKRAILSYIRSSEVLTEPKGAYVTLSLKRGENEIKLITEKEGRELKFNVASDFHSGYTIGLIGLAEMLQDNPDFIILNGDIIDYGNKAEYILVSALT
ncbi:MAG TPA: metallophosphoesterase family protein, partial [Candidatus Saccharibacteria bacterium]|nr:metallophosphoesterase family protein [Candidatus Saccharibacteria bacterium]